MRNECVFNWHVVFVARCSFSHHYFLRRHGNVKLLKALYIFYSCNRETKARQGRYQHNRSFDFTQLRAPRASTLYAYSSSEESLSLPFVIQNPDEETVETLCETHHATSTPSLAETRQRLKSAWGNNNNNNNTRRSTYQPISDSTSADDPPDLPQQCQLLLQQTAAMKTTLSGLEAEFGASRRDLGWLQENLTSVRTATGSVSDKVAKMQSQVATMERQIASAVKVFVKLVTSVSITLLFPSI